MTVDELRAALADLPGDLPVILSYETGSHLDIGQARAGRSWDQPRGALFLDGQVTEEEFDRHVLVV